MCTTELLHEADQLSVNGLVQGWSCPLYIKIWSCPLTDVSSTLGLASGAGPALHFGLIKAGHACHHGLISFSFRLSGFSGGIGRNIFGVVWRVDASPHRVWLVWRGVSTYGGC